jgi:dienelactone hydrolase
MLPAMPERWRLRAGRAAVAVLWLAAPVALAEPPPLEAFFHVPQLTALALSPDGRWLAALSPADDDQALFVIDADSLRAVARLTIPEPRLDPLYQGTGDFRIDRFWWVNDDRLLLSVTARGGHMSYLRLVGRDGGNVQKILHRPPKPLLYHRPDEILSLLPDDPQHLLLPFPRTRAGELLGYEVRRVKVTSGRTQLEQRVLPRVLRWYADPAGAVRAGWGRRGDEEFLLFRTGGEGSFDELGELGGVPIDTRELRVLGVGPGRLLYVASRHQGGRFAIYVYDLEEGRFLPASFSDPRFDVAGPLVVDAAGVPLGVAYVGDFERVHWFEPDWQQRQRRIDAARPDAQNVITSWDRAHKRFVVRSESDRDAPSWWLFEEPGGALRHLTRERPDLPPEALAESRVVTVTGPDDLSLPGILTRPSGSEGRRLPFLVELRGGGWPRARRGFDAGLQFLVSRGWGVLRVDGRGAEGHGLAHERAADGAWARVAPADLTAAASWLVAEGHADADRLCAMGRGYGGYAALMAVLEAPERFRCAVSLAGISDPEAFLAHRSRLSDAPLWRRRLGDDPGSAPLSRARKLEVPLFLAHGELDLRVPPAQTFDLVDALRGFGRPLEVLRFPHEGHAFLREESRLELYGELEKFLAKFAQAPDPEEDEGS